MTESHKDVFYKFFQKNFFSPSFFFISVSLTEASKRKMRENALNREHNEQQVTEANVNDDDDVDE